MNTVSCSGLRIRQSLITSQPVAYAPPSPPPPPACGGAPGQVDLSVGRILCSMRYTRDSENIAAMKALYHETPLQDSITKMPVKPLHRPTDPCKFLEDWDCIHCCWVAGVEGPACIWQVASPVTASSKPWGKAFWTLGTGPPTLA